MVSFKMRPKYVILMKRLLLKQGVTLYQFCEVCDPVKWANVKALKVNRFSCPCSVVCTLYGHFAMLRGLWNSKNSTIRSH